MATNLFARLVTHWGPGDRETFEERAAIHEYAGNLPREKAEALAYEAQLKHIEARHNTNTQQGRSNGTGTDAGAR